MPDLPSVLTVRELADLLRVSTWGVYAAIRRDEITVVRVGTSIRIPRAEVERLLAS